MGASVPLPAGRATSLLVFLLLDPVAHGRETVAELLWPDLPPGAARRGLARTIHQVRRSDIGGWLETTRDAVRLRPPPGTRIDVHAFEAAVRAGGREGLERAAAVYGGPLAPEVYDDWIAPRRAALADAHRSALHALARASEQDGALDAALRAYHRLVAEDPADESGHGGLMRIYLRSGHPAAVLVQYDRLRAVLGDEYGIEPGAEARALRASAARDAGGMEAPGPRPFVGRHRERAAVLAVLDRPLRSRPGLVLVEGEPGMGMSHFLEVVAEDARWRGFSVGMGNVAEPDPAPPYAPLDAALRGLLGGGGPRRIREALSGGALAAAASVLPELGGDADTDDPRPRVPAGVTAILRATQPDGRCLLLLDDLHRAGPALWDALSFLDEPDAPPIVVVLGYRGAVVRSDARAWGALRRLDAGLRPVRVRLEGLSDAEVGELGAALGAPFDADGLADLAAATAGAPLFVEQAIRSGIPARPGALAYTDLLDRRLARLTDAARRALEGAAILGASFTEADWIGVVGRELGPGGTAIGELVAARLVRVSAGIFTIEHDLVRRHVLDAIPPDRRRDLHAAAALTLRAAWADPGAIAAHLDHAGLAGDAAAEYVRAAESALRRAAPRESLAHAERGLELEPPGGRHRVRLLTLRHRALGTVLDLDRWRRALDEAEREALAMADDPARLAALEGRLSLHALDGDLAGLEATAIAALDLGRAVGDPAAEARVLARQAWHVSESVGDNRRALPLFRRAARLAERAGDEPTLVRSFVGMSGALRALGRCRASYALALRATAVSEVRPGMHAARTHALADLAEVSLELGRWEEGYVAIERAVEAYRALDDPWGLGSALHARSLLAGGLGLGDEAIAAAEELVELGRRVGLEPTSDYGAWHRTTLARAQLAAGDADAAGTVLAELGGVTPAAIRPRLALSLARGLRCLARDDPGAAVAALRPGYEAWRRTPEPRDVAAVLWLAIAAARAGERTLAREAIDAAVVALGRTDIERHDVLTAFAWHAVTGDASRLHEAHAAMARQADRITDPGLRRSFETRVALHREVERLRGAASPALGEAVARFARADVPLGRRIRDDEWVEVRWRVTPEGGATADRATRAARRRLALAALVEAAAAAGARPTDDRLAVALGVSRRTVLRDMAALAAARGGIPLATRRRCSRRA